MGNLFWKGAHRPSLLVGMTLVVWATTFGGEIGAQTAAPRSLVLDNRLIEDLDVDPVSPPLPPPNGWSTNDRVPHHPIIHRPAPHRPVPHRPVPHHPVPQGGGWEFFSGIDGSKQPQDFGVNANLGARFSLQTSGALLPRSGIGYHVGSAVEWSDNAVRVFEVLGEETKRFQNHTTAGLFRRGTAAQGSTLGQRIGWAFAYDHLYQSGFDTVSLGQFRTAVSFAATARDELGTRSRFDLDDDRATFGDTRVTLRSINQHDLYWRHFFAGGVQTTTLIGVAERHGEDNIVTGDKSSFDEALVIGADFLAPIAGSFAIYGETNLTMPADTGTVDAFLGLAFYPGRRASTVRRRRYDPMLPLASDTTFGVDLLR